MPGSAFLRSPSSIADVFPASSPETSATIMLQPLLVPSVAVIALDPDIPGRGIHRVQGERQLIAGILDQHQLSHRVAGSVFKASDLPSQAAVNSEMTAISLRPARWRPTSVRRVGDGEVAAGMKPGVRLEPGPGGGNRLAEC